MTTTQITLYLDESGKLHAQAPGKNGARNKLNLPDQNSTIVPSVDSIADNLIEGCYTLAEELFSQFTNAVKLQEEQKARELKLKKLRHERIIEYTAANYPSALKFIENSPYKSEGFFTTRKISEGEIAARSKVNRNKILEDHAKAIAEIVL